MSVQRPNWQDCIAVKALIGVFAIVLCVGACWNPPGENGPITDPDVTPDWYVPDDFGSIQAAIDNASAGEIILVASGTYSENISLKDGVTLLGEDRDTTIIDGGSNYCFGYGCGMYNENTTVTLTDCLFMYNRDADSSGLPTTRGGGIYNASGTDCTLINCVFVANSSAYGTLNGSSGSTSTHFRSLLPTPPTSPTLPVISIPAGIPRTSVTSATCASHPDLPASMPVTTAMCPQARPPISTTARASSTARIPTAPPLWTWARMNTDWGTKKVP